MHRSVQLYRHGDRSPLSTFPKNTIKDDAWPQGYGQLTKIGIQQAYNLGKWLKDRYKNFLISGYKPKEIYVRSTDYDRTLMSAEGVLAGLFPPLKEEEWNPDIHWQPIPVHTVPLSEEKLLIYPIYKCPEFKRLLQQFKQQIKSKDLLKNYMAIPLTSQTNATLWNKIYLSVQLEGKPCRMEGNLPSLLGLDWFDALGLSVAGVHATAGLDQFEGLIKEFAAVFDGSLVQELFHMLEQGSIFAKQDLTQAYQQLPVDAAVAEAQTIVTHEGAFKCWQLQFREIYKYPLPNWADKKTMQRVKSLLEYVVNGALGGPLKNKKSKLQGGILVKHILEKMTSAINNNGLKMIMYSAHDMTIIALQIALGVYNKLLPPYAATHIFELYEEDNGSHTIEMYYRNNTAVEPHMLTLPGCSKACPLEKFQNLVTPILPTKEC
ncbi:PREDICTED: prostatic acid phosphatase-like [Thamnophis sirtalis]|uniref:acid phosphatase n=1 Tax=Thamnophis sirtalis TaxID=35019 RepID=A0A6I9YIW3_9SAUR|nr:PREDICTED: prostatic acid phosphatase-like [Thamnophis sirtalis]